MLVAWVIGLIQSGHFHCDYMLPAEIEIFMLIGMVLLLTAAILEKIFINPVAWMIGAIILLLVGANCWP